MDIKKDRFEIADELDSINERHVTLLDQENEDGRGWDYYCNGQVLQPAVLGNRLTGIIRELTEDYRVQITITEHEVTNSCDCGVKEGVCIHTISLLYSWVNDRDGFINIGNSMKQLHFLEKDELITIISRIIDNNPSNIKYFDEPEFDSDEYDIDDLLM